MVHVSLEPDYSMKPPVTHVYTRRVEDSSAESSSCNVQSHYDEPSFAEESSSPDMPSSPNGPSLFDAPSSPVEASLLEDSSPQQLLGVW